MGSATNYTENKMLDHTVKGTVFTQPTNLYIALHTADPTDTGTGTEVAGGSYARVVCNAWNAASSRAAANTGAVNFAAASGSWGTVGWWSIWDASSGGNCLFHGTLNPSQVITTPQVFSIAAGAMVISVPSSNGVTNYLAHKWLDHVLKTSAFTQPTNIYVGLSTANPGDSGGALAEPVGNAYARVVCNTWNAASGGLVDNTGAITFTAASGAWGTTTHGCVFDAVSAGNLLLYGALNSSQSPVLGNVLQYAAGVLDITLD